MNGPKEGASAIPTLETPNTFEMPVEIDGLPFIFDGSISEGRKQAYLSLRVPDAKDEIKKMEAAGIPVPDEMKVEGVVGFIGSVKSGSERADLYITTIQSFSDQLAPDSKYRGAHIGRFLLDNFVTLADMKGWRVSDMAGGSGRLTTEEVEAWLGRKGFERVAASDDILVRAPREPDMTQPIVKVLQS